MFPSLATMKPMLTSFQCCSLKVFLSSGERTIKADGDVEVEEPQASQRKGKDKTNRIRKDEEIKLLITLYEDRAFLCDIGNKMEVATHRCQNNIVSQGQITKANGIF